MSSAMTAADAKRHFGRAIDSLASLRLTVTLLLLSIVLVFAGTLDQVHLGVWAVQRKYFQSFFVWMTLPGTDVSLPVFPGGYLLGGILLANLVAAFAVRFKLSWRKSGIILVHSGLLFLLIGQAVSGFLQRDGQIRIGVGQSRQYVESLREYELALTEVTDPTVCRVIAISASRLRSKSPVQVSALPFSVESEAYYPNAVVRMRVPSMDGPADPELTGPGASVVIQAAPEASAEGQINWPAAVVRISGPNGKIGTMVISAMMTVPQAFTVAGRRWQAELRLRRDYLGYTLILDRFTHEVYPGTDIPRRFASAIRIYDPRAGMTRKVNISMNNPLRYGGLAFYQAGFENDDRTSVLQVVRNPSWRLPYASCALIGLGLLVQFSISLVRYLRRDLAARTSKAAVRVAVRQPQVIIT